MRIEENVPIRVLTNNNSMVILKWNNPPIQSHFTIAQAKNLINLIQTAVEYLESEIQQNSESK